MRRLPRPTPSDTRAPAYGRVAVTLHWLLALGLLAQLVLGWWMLDLPKQPPGLRAGWFNMHKSLGITWGALIALRWAWHRTHRVPLPQRLPRWQRRAAALNHGGLYLCMVVLPLSGYLGSSWSGHPVRLFGHALPAWSSAWPAAKTAMSSVHAATVWLFMALLAMHVTAALWHMAQRDGIAARMGLRWPKTSP